jgi:2-iminoacetate synthase ThiH
MTRKLSKKSKAIIRNYCNNRCRFTTHYDHDTWRPECAQCPLGSLRAESLGKSEVWLKTGNEPVMTEEYLQKITRPQKEIRR